MLWTKNGHGQDRILVHHFLPLRRVQFSLFTGLPGFACLFSVYFLLPVCLISCDRWRLFRYGCFYLVFQDLAVLVPLFLISVCLPMGRCFFYLLFLFILLFLV
jgi:hypothetical protein